MDKNRPKNVTIKSTKTQKVVKEIYKKKESGKDDTKKRNQKKPTKCQKKRWKNY